MLYPTLKILLILYFMIFISMTKFGCRFKNRHCIVYSSINSHINERITGYLNSSIDSYIYPQKKKFQKKKLIFIGFRLCHLHEFLNTFPSPTYDPSIIQTENLLTITNSTITIFFITSSNIVRDFQIMKFPTPLI